MISGEELAQMLADPEGLVVTPILDPSQIGKASIDVRLGPDIIVSRRATGATSFDPADGQAFREALRQRQAYVRRGIGDPFHLQPGEFVIARTLEYVQLPAGVRAQALGRSSWGRLGLVVATATLVQPGFRGTITLELTNLGNTPMVLSVGLPIAQLTFSRDEKMARSKVVSCSTESKEREGRVATWWQNAQNRRPKSRYTGQLRPELSQLDQDRDLWWVSPMAVKYVVGVVGERFSGKSMVVNFLVSRRGFRLYRLAQFVYAEARRRGENVEDHDVLRKVGDEMREQWGADVFAKLAFSKIRSELLDPDRRRSPAAIVIEGFKVPEELEAWQKTGIFKPMLVEAPSEERLERALGAGSLRDELDQEGLPYRIRRKARIEWLQRRVDAVGDGRHLAKPVIDRARQIPSTIIIDNSQGVAELADTLHREVQGLDRWARGHSY